MASLRLSKSPSVLEKHEQEGLFVWLMHLPFKGRRVGDFAFAIPNGSFRGYDRKLAAIHAAALRRQGLRPGVPDVLVAIPVAPYAGLFIELKRIGAPKPDPEQLAWHAKLTFQGYRCEVCYGFLEAKRAVEMYFGMPS